MPGFNLEDYEPVADRIERFWKDHVEGRITTSLHHRDEKSFIVQAMIWRNARSDNEWSGPDATGWAEEIIGSSNVNRTSALENCETSAIGRALANLGYAVKNRASREEMVKAQPEPRPRSGGRKVTPNPSESHEEAPRTNGNGETAVQVTRLKTELLERLAGDKPKAKMIWRETLSNYGLGPDDLPPPDVLEGIEADLRMAIVESLKVEVAQIMDPMPGEESML